MMNRAARLGSGDGVSKNIKKSRYYYTCAANLGSAHARYELGMSLLYDEPKDLDAGIDWIRSAALRGLVDAQELLGDIYSNGLFGCRKNKRTAEAWYRHAADAGSKNALDALRYIKR